jgi:hypothetical protein
VDADDVKNELACPELLWIGIKFHKEVEKFLMLFGEVAVVLSFIRFTLKFVVFYNPFPGCLEWMHVCFVTERLRCYVIMKDVKDGV